MEIVLDSNVLFRTLISGGEITKLFFDVNLKILAPEKLKRELIKNKDEILFKSKFPKEIFEESLSILLNKIELVPEEEYAPFISKAKQLLGNHEKDEDFIALCLAKNIKLWTYEDLLFKIGFGISTKQISEELSKL